MSAEDHAAKVRAQIKAVWEVAYAAALLDGKSSGECKADAMAAVYIAGTIAGIQHARKYRPPKEETTP